MSNEVLFGIYPRETDNIQVQADVGNNIRIYLMLIRALIMDDNNKQSSVSNQCLVSHIVSLLGDRVGAVVTYCLLILEDQCSLLETRRYDVHLFVYILGIFNRL